ncbi:hypothetical protein BGE01nite_24420 [Brevifollis gellanilyticus]|uniref:NodB homology domain-containing protein n=2 Tax=Brevifollis gellanilyticus TaxID=748831 RepID=A0A512M9Z2_9BACT|nr:hypothetical protein BGE01nite_24420 [Brevifollis gellanilyticus]
MTVPAPGAAATDPEDEPKDGETVVKAVAVPEMMPLVPPTAPPVQPKEGKIVFTRCELQPPAIALTFDDGPHPDFTPKLLDILKKENIKVTFFLVGRCVNAYPNVVKRMVDEGHEIASHSWSHPLLTSLGDQSLDSQMQRTHDAIIKACGVTPTLYRPPYGATRISQRKFIHDKFGYLAILWDVDPLDWQHPRTSKKVHDRVLEQTRIGSIILCHDIHETTVDAMPTTIADLKARGFQFLTVSQLLDLEKQAPALPNSPKLPPQAIAAMAAAAAPATPAAPPQPVPPPKPAPKPMDTSKPLSLEAPGEIKL